MKEFVEKLIERLEEKAKSSEKDMLDCNLQYHQTVFGVQMNTYEKAIEIVKQLAEEYKKEPYAIYETIRSNRLDCEVPSDYFEQIKEVRVIDEWTEESKVFNQDSTKKNQGWIPVTERLPEDGDNRLYMCIVENHEEDVPMFCQYCEDHGFGFWHDFYDEHTLGFLDSEFKTNEELGYEKVIAWQPLPDPYKEQQKKIPTNHYTERFNRVV